MKWLFFMFLIMLTIIIGVGGFSYLQIKMQSPPSIEDALWAVQTYSQDGDHIPSRVYYTSAIEIVGGKTVIQDYWIYDGSRYIKHSDEKELPKDSRIIRRQR